MTKAVYSLRHPHGFHKIGASNQPYNRYQAIQITTPYQIELYAILETPYSDTRIEKEVHDKLDVYRHRGEWFNAPTDIVDTILESYSGRDGFDLSNPQLNGDSDGSDGFETRSL